MVSGWLAFFSAELIHQSSLALIGLHCFEDVLIELGGLFGQSQINAGQSAPGTGLVFIGCGDHPSVIKLGSVTRSYTGRGI